MDKTTKLYIDGKLVLDDGIWHHIALVDEIRGKTYHTWTKYSEDGDTVYTRNAVEHGIAINAMQVQQIYNEG